jgi:parvulin-like peptidyl-prolyl isomerase
MFELLTAIFILQGTQAAIATPKELQKPPAQTTVVAVVNGKNITAGQVQEYLYDWYAFDATEDLMIAVMVDDAAKGEGVSATAAEVQDYLGTLMEDAKKSMPGVTDVDSELRRRSMPKSRLALRSRIEVLVRKIAEKGFKPAEQRKISWIYFGPRSAGDAGKAEAKSRADAAAARLAKGESWDAVVLASDHADTKNSKGLLGWIQTDELPAEVKLPIEKLSAGGVTGVIESAGTYAIYRVEAVGATGDEAKAAKESYLERNVGKVFQKIRTDSKVEHKKV